MVKKKEEVCAKRRVYLHDCVDKMFCVLLPNLAVKAGPLSVQCSIGHQFPSIKPPLRSGVIVPTTLYELGGRPEPNQWDCFTKALFPNACLCRRPAQLPDRRHKHAMALNMEIHQACEMFEL